MGLERCNVLFLLANATGLLPHRMVVSKRTKEFERLDSGWSQHPATWCWIAVVVLLQLIHALAMTFYQIDFFLKYDKPAIYLIVMICWQVSYNLIKLVPLLLLFRTDQLQSAFRLLLQVDRLLHPLPLCSSRRKTVLGIIFSIVLVILAQNFPIHIM